MLRDSSAPPPPPPPPRVSLTQPSHSKYLLPQRNAPSRRRQPPNFHPTEDNEEDLDKSNRERHRTRPYFSPEPSHQTFSGSLPSGPRPVLSAPEPSGISRTLTYATGQMSGPVPSLLARHGNARSTTHGAGHHPSSASPHDKPNLPSLGEALRFPVSASPGSQSIDGLQYFPEKTNQDILIPPLGARHGSVRSTITSRRAGHHPSSASPHDKPNLPSLGEALHSPVSVSPGSQSIHGSQHFPEKTKQGIPIPSQPARHGSVRRTSHGAGHHPSSASPHVKPNLSSLDEALHFLLSVSLLLSVSPGSQSIHGSQHFPENTKQGIPIPSQLARHGSVRRTSHGAGHHPSSTSPHDKPNLPSLGEALHFPVSVSPGSQSTHGSQHFPEKTKQAIPIPSQLARHGSVRSTSRGAGHHPSPASPHDKPHMPSLGEAVRFPVSASPGPQSIDGLQHFPEKTRQGIPIPSHFARQGSVRSTGSTGRGAGHRYVASLNSDLIREGLHEQQTSSSASSLDNSNLSSLSEAVPIPPDLDVHLSASNPLQPVSPIDPKSVEALESMGGVGTLLRDPNMTRNGGQKGDNADAKRKGGDSKSAAATCQSSTMCSSTSSLTSSSPTKSTGSQSCYSPQGFGRSQYSPRDVVNTQTSSTQGHVSTSQSSPSCILVSPEISHPTLSCWIKNMKKLSSLIDRLQELASSAPTEHQSQLMRQVNALRATSKKQEEQFIDFLQLSEEYANEYLLDIDAYLQQQSSFLAKLEGRLEAAKKLRGEAAELQMLYESETVAAMKNFRATALPRPLPKDHALFREVDSVLFEIKHCYTELYKFWTEEISRVMEASEKRRVDRTDFERWRNFHANLKQTIESWKDELPSGDAQAVLRNNACLSRETDIGTIASSLSSAMSSVTSALERLPSTNSVKHLPSCQPSIQRVYLALQGNRDVCLSFLRRCADYGEKVIGCRLSSTALPTPFRVMASHELWERTMRLLSERTGVSVKNTASVQGSRKVKAAYKKARSLEEKTTSGLETLLGSWTTVTDSHACPDGDFPDAINPEQLRELWEKARYSVRAALANLRDEPAPQLFNRPAPPVPTRLKSVMERWMMKLRVVFCS